jgi:hypothetical protein
VSLWSVLRGGGRQSPVKHEVRGPVGRDRRDQHERGELNRCIMHRVHTSIYRGERRTTLAKAYGIKESAIGNMLRNIARTWGTNWEHNKNPLRT